MLELFKCFKAITVKGLISYLCLHYCSGLLWWSFKTDKNVLKMDSHVQIISDKIMLRLKQLLLCFIVLRPPRPPPFKWALELSTYQGNCPVAMPLIIQNHYWIELLQSPSCSISALDDLLLFFIIFKNILLWRFPKQPRIYTG